ncbi:MAG: hypothetical protein ABFR31_03210 [Thermodesulfobacteriota bacterium]
MKRIHQTLLFSIFILFLFSRFSLADQEEKDFDFLLVLTQQDSEMNWWFNVPSQFGPKVSTIDNVSKGEHFKILPIYSNYGTKSENEVDITYDFEIIKPDGTVDESGKDVSGFKGPAPGPFLLPSLGMLIVSFDPEDPYGEYSINITAFDHIKKQKVKKSQKITLKKFSIKELEGSLKDWYLSYPTNPKPSFALSTFINPPRAYIDEKGHHLWSGLWLYKHIYTENMFLIPHTVEFYKTKATKQQQKDIILLFYLLNKTNELPVGDEFKEYLTNLRKMNIPDPYAAIETGDQLDMLWAEYFATSRIKPIRQILTALNLSANVGTLEKVKSGELKKSNDVLKKTMLEAVFQSALWSIMSNFKQSQLLFQYCVGLYESDQLNEMEKGYLGAMIKKVSEESQKTIQQANPADAKSRAAD